MPLKTLLGLIFINLIWSVHPIAGKGLLLAMGPLQAAWLRYFSAFCAYLVIAGISSAWSRFKATPLQFFIIPDKTSEKILILIMGVTTFCLSPFFQLRGLSLSLATEDSIIVALEPLIAAFLAWLILKESVTRSDILGFCFAIIGFVFLAGIHPVDLWKRGGIGAGDSHMIGNLLMALALLGEAIFAIASKKLIRNYSPLAIFGSALAVGVMCLTAAVMSMALKHGFENKDGTLVYSYFFQMVHLDFKTLLATLWIGPLGTTVGYLIYMISLVDVSVVAVSLFLFLQPLAGVFLGYLFLSERLNGLQNFGSILILSAVLLPNALRIRNRTH